MGVSAEQVFRQIGLICKDPLFKTAKRQKSFLEYICRKTLEGRAKEIKEYSIAVEAFGLPDSFDQQFDPRIRVEAMRLRKKLAMYYQNHHDSEIQIKIPKGSYVPEFSTNFSAICGDGQSKQDESNKDINSQNPAIIRSLCNSHYELEIVTKSDSSDKELADLVDLFIDELAVSFCDGLDCVSKQSCADKIRLEIKTRNQQDALMFYFFMSTENQNRIFSTEKLVLNKNDSKGNTLSRILQVAGTIGSILERYKNAKEWC